jgi:hypothetical protein
MSKPSAKLQAPSVFYLWLLFSDMPTANFPGAAGYCHLVPGAQIGYTYRLADTTATLNFFAPGSTETKKSI